MVRENGETVTPEKLRGRILCLVDRDEPGGYVVRNMEAPEDVPPLLPPGVVLPGTELLGASVTLLVGPERGGERLLSYRGGA